MYMCVYSLQMLKWTMAKILICDVWNNVPKINQYVVDIKEIIKKDAHILCAFFHCLNVTSKGL